MTNLQRKIQAARPRMSFNPNQKRGSLPEKRLLGESKSVTLFEIHLPQFLYFSCSSRAPRKKRNSLRASTHRRTNSSAPDDYNSDAVDDESVDVCEEDDHDNVDDTDEEDSVDEDEEFKKRPKKARRAKPIKRRKKWKGIVQHELLTSSTHLTKLLTPNLCPFKSFWKFYLDEKVKIAY